MRKTMSVTFKFHITYISPMKSDYDKKKLKLFDTTTN